MQVALGQFICWEIVWESFTDCLSYLWCYFGHEVEAVNDLEWSSKWLDCYLNTKSKILVSY